MFKGLRVKLTPVVATVLYPVTARLLMDDGIAETSCVKQTARRGSENFIVKD